MFAPAFFFACPLWNVAAPNIRRTFGANQTPMFGAVRNFEDIREGSHLSFLLQDLAVIFHRERCMSIGAFRKIVGQDPQAVLRRFHGRR